MKTVIFACVHNAGRSQMAAAYFNALADPAQAHALSAGTNPGPHVHPEVMTAMAEVVPGLKIEDWPLEDPKGKPVERVREIRDEVRSRVERLLDREGCRP